MNNMIISLDWDSSFFALKIGRIDYEFHNDHVLFELLKNANAQDYNLIYVFTDTVINIKEKVLQSYNGKLVDIKTVFGCNDFESANFKSTVTKLYDPKDINDLYKLALISGEHSRFKTDPMFPIKSFERLYKTWIEKSISGEIADSIYMDKLNGILRGMMTVRWHPNKVVIGLIAVLPEFHGKNIGTSLINFLKMDCIKKNINIIEVSTQGQNILACSFYKKNNFSVTNETNIYHFWLKSDHIR